MRPATPGARPDFVRAAVAAAAVLATHLAGIAARRVGSCAAEDPPIAVRARGERPAAAMPAAVTASAYVVARPVASIAEEDEFEDAFAQLGTAVDAYPVPAPEPDPPTPEKSADRERHFRELLDLTQATLGATHANCISQLRQLAMLLVEEERWEEAEAELRLLVQRSRQCHGSEHDRTLHALSVHAGVLWRLERSDEARASLEELVAAREAEVQQSAWAIADDDASQQLGRAEEALADALTDLASVLFEGGDGKSAIPLLRRARELLAKLYGEGDEQAVACADMLGRALGAEGDVGGATEACRASIRHKEELYGTDSVEVADAHNELSVLMQQTGDVEKAEVEARAAFELYLKLYGELHAFTATALNNWALLLQARRRRRRPPLARTPAAAAARPPPCDIPPPAHTPAAPIAVPRRARGSRERTPPLPQSVRLRGGRRPRRRRRRPPLARRSAVGAGQARRR